ncbi:hypothetical protein H696_03130 [Fonticula alba]|uniref:Transcription factor Pcc1 n=1 Tax=Fonticula alba TaxID=691883 RepID=A0A058Z929_FONAL|nr:hypothetical protein H696_03130 [Fonticula alba]KCV70780.1 hypothetical protein H696_03130 [Fonticula alba]|eukprot:XP_009495296.1 hypothetical protein H696_03130 [Fonticula alba]
MSTHELTTRIPFPTARQAEIVLRSVNADPEPVASVLNRTMEVQDNVLLITIRSESLKTIRSCMSSMLDMIQLSIETQARFSL